MTRSDGERKAGQGRRRFQSQRRKPKGRPVNGILLLDKPLGITSNAALQKVKHLFAAEKAGHTGSLDPLATGVLPLCFGEATKFSQYLLDADKAYRYTVRFGRTTTTGDAEGETLSDTPAPQLTRAEVEAAMLKLTGEIEQVPSMYSAIKHNGQPLYKLAREGVEVERQARRVTVYRSTLTDFRPGDYPEADIEVHVSKGTYVRSLAEDMGAALGCGGYVTRLRRLQAGPFVEAACVTIEQLEQALEGQTPDVLDRFLLPMEQAIDHLQIVLLPESTGFYFRQGQPVMEASALATTRTGEMVRVMVDQGSTKEFLGVAEVLEDGRIAPRKLLRSGD